MQEIAFPGFKFQKFSGDYAPTHVAFGHWYDINDKLRLIFFFTFCAVFPSFISNTSFVSINFRANLDAQNAGNGQPRSQGFLIRTRGETRKPWSGPARHYPKNGSI
jgi:hypothetical protein